MSRATHKLLKLGSEKKSSNEPSLNELEHEPKTKPVYYPFSKRARASLIELEPVRKPKRAYYLYIFITILNIYLHNNNYYFKKIIYKNIIYKI
ncbi:hypothetical protein Hanom_Chr12g01065761 [Helianthus anomalus]